jgi:hypothetical protein
VARLIDQIKSYSQSSSDSVDDDFEESSLGVGPLRINYPGSSIPQPNAQQNMDQSPASVALVEAQQSLLKGSQTSIESEVIGSLVKAVNALRSI